MIGPWMEVAVILGAGIYYRLHCPNDYGAWWIIAIAALGVIICAAWTWLPAGSTDALGWDASTVTSMTVLGVIVLFILLLAAAMCSD